jgi:hypothetical protein
MFFERHVRTAMDWDEYEGYYLSILANILTSNILQAIAGELSDAPIPPIHIRDNLARLYKSDRCVNLRYDLQYDSSQRNCSRVQIMNKVTRSPRDTLI